MPNQTTALFAFLAILSASSALAQVPGDECSNALTAVIGTNTVNTAAMTPSASPELPDKTCPALGWNQATKDAWFRFDAPSAGRLSLEFCASTYNTSVVVYEGACGSLERIACGDEGCPGSNRTRMLGIYVEGGPIYVRVGGFLSAAGTATFSLAFDATGQLGVYRFGQYGYGAPFVPADLGRATQLAIGSKHSWNQDHLVALRSDGTVICWGQNGYGESDVPKGLSDIVTVAAGDEFTLAVRKDGTVIGWGNNYAGQCSPPPEATGVIAVDGGSDHSIALRFNGQVVCWGRDWEGQCSVPSAASGSTHVAAGQYFSASLRGDGALVWWGSWYFESSPPYATGNYQDIDAGKNHLAAVRSDGTVACWGDNTYGQCDVPPGLTDVRSVAGGINHTVALRLDGSVVAWGDDSYGQCTPDRNFGTAFAVAAGGNTTGLLTLRDINGNGVNDPTELTSFDCDANGVHDGWDFEVGLIEDCNGNFLGDSCEKQAQIIVHPPAYAPIGFGHPYQLVIPDAAYAINRCELRVRANGDFDGYLEYVRLSFPGWERIALRESGICRNPQEDWNWEQYSFTPEAFNAGIRPDGSWRLDIQPSSAVDPGVCLGDTWLEIELTYAAATAADCDGNGRLDSCQIADGTAPDTNGNGIIDTCENPIVACPTDFNADRTTGPADLAVLLGSWNSVGTNGTDLNGDGTVNSADLTILLGAWGPCPES